MIKQLALSGAVATLLFGITSCKKEATAVTPTSPKTPFGLVKSTADMDGEIVTYQYDDQFRLKEKRSSTYRNSYSYPPGQVVVDVYDSTNSLARTIHYTLDANGRAVSSDAGETFHYDGDGYLIKQSRKNDKTIEYAIEQGNRKAILENGKQALSLTYYQNIAEMRKTGEEFCNGRPNQNLVQTSNDAAQMIYLNYVYHYDLQGRIDRVSWSGPGGYQGYLIYEYFD
ncbi:MAG: hypothetical protein U0T84_03605 [Chitinophagales bacterium]